MFYCYLAIIELINVIYEYNNIIQLLGIGNW